MRSCIMILLLACIAQANAQDPMDVLTDALVDKLVNGVAHMHRPVNVPSFRSRVLVPHLPRTVARLRRSSWESSSYREKFAEREVPKWKKAIATLAVFGALLGGMSAPPAFSATDSAKVGTCLLSSCQKELASCILNPKCLANVICLNQCNNRADESTCQIRCGDIFENDVVGTFNACAVSQKKCVPQRQDDGEYPIPPLEAQVKSFDTAITNGRWYISAGLNKAFDTFDCQVHFFNSPEPGKFFAKLFWRISEPDGEFFTKDTVQRFVQDPKNPAHLLNHDNEYLHYQDDWWVLDYEKDDFMLVYYKGSNDAWDGYGGGFLYTRSPTLRPELVPRLEAAMEKWTNGPYKWKDFTVTDNSCKLITEDTTVLREKFARKLLITEEQQLQEALTVVRSNALSDIDRTEKGAEKSIASVEKELEAFLSETLPGLPAKKATPAR